MVGDPGIASVGRVPRVTGERHVSWRQELALGAVEYHIIYENNPVGKKLVGLRGKKRRQAILNLIIGHIYLH